MATNNNKTNADVEAVVEDGVAKEVTPEETKKEEKTTAKESKKDEKAAAEETKKEEAEEEKAANESTESKESKNEESKGKLTVKKKMSTKKKVLIGAGITAAVGLVAGLVITYMKNKDADPETEFSFDDDF